MSIKRWLGASVLLGTGILPAAHADDDLSDLTFLPAARQFVGATSFGYGTDSGDLDDASGFRQSARHSDTQRVAQSFDYGITSRLSVFAAVSQQWTTARYDLAGDVRTAHSVTGSQLMVGLTHRLLDQEHYAFDLDLTATVPGSFTVAITREFDNLTVKANAGVYHAGRHSGFDLVRGMDVDVGRFWGYDAGLQGQLRVTSAISVNLAVEYVSSNQDTVNASADGTAFTIQYPHQVNFGAAINYEWIPHRLAMQLGGSYQVLSQRRDVYDDPTLDLQTARRTRHGVGLGFIYSMNGR